MTTTAAEADQDRAFLCVSHSPIMTLPEMDQFGAQYQTAMVEARSFVGDFAPDLVVMFSPDHMNLLTPIRPQFTIVLSGELLAEFDIPPTALNVATDAAAGLCRELVGRGFDIAVGEGVRIDHGLGLSLRQLFPQPETVPLLPIIVNAIGFPLGPPERALAFGSAVGETLRSFPGRVLFIGSGGLSHHPPFPDPEPGAVRLTPEERIAAMADAARYIDPAWDREVLTHLVAGDPAWFRAMSQADIDRRGGGANEIRVWTAAWSAAECRPAAVTAYEPVPEWITGMGVAYGPRQENPTTGENPR